MATPLRLRSDRYVRSIRVDAPESSEGGGRASEKVMTRLVEGLNPSKRILATRTEMDIGEHYSARACRHFLHPVLSSALLGSQLPK